MQWPQTSKCPHFCHLKLCKNIFLPHEKQCKICSAPKDNLWLCLAKQCGDMYCGRRSFAHLQQHFEEVKKKQGMHCLYINVLSAEILCLTCKAYIADQEQLNESHRKGQESRQKFANSAFRLRSKILPWLTGLGSFKSTNPPLQTVQGQLQNSQAHRKTNMNSVGIFSDQYNHSIHAAVQFMAHCSYFRDVVLRSKCQKEKDELIYWLKDVLREVNEAKRRVVRCDELDKAVYKAKPHLLTYQRKDPLQIFLYFIQTLHLHLFFYILSPAHKLSLEDQWDLFYSSSSKHMLKMVCPIYDSIEIKLKLNYHCGKCKKNEHYGKIINYMKLNLKNKKKRNRKEVQKEVHEHRGEPSLKKRSNSLVRFFFKEEEMPISVHQLIIDMMRSPLHKEKLCLQCRQPLKKQKIQIQSLPNYLILQICRMSPQSYSIDETPVTFSAGEVDFGAFTVNKDVPQLYQFQTAIGIEKGGLFNVMARNQYNRQFQIFRNQEISYSDKINPYILCYKRLPAPQTVQNTGFFIEELNKKPQKLVPQTSQNIYILPDFLKTQIQHAFFPSALFNPFVCKHNRFKPDVFTLEENKTKISKYLYRQICQIMNCEQRYEPYECFECLDDIKLLQIRRKRQKEAIKKYDAIKTEIHCMVASEWLNRLSQFLYAKTKPNYMSKGWPLPGKIDNSSLLQGKKCKPFLKNGTDYKTVNFYVWKFLKELYGGGTEIRYKWKSENTVTLDEQWLQQIKIEASQLKGMLGEQLPFLSPSKKSSFMQQTNYISEDEFQLEKIEN